MKSKVSAVSDFADSYIVPAMALHNSQLDQRFSPKRTSISSMLPIESTQKQTNSVADTPSITMVLEIAAR